MGRILLISNGHGEDIIAAVIGQKLQALGYGLEALPLVGRGTAYERTGFVVHGPRRQMPSGGFVLDDPTAFLRDLRAGWLAMSLGHWQAARQVAARSEAIVAVGDLYALAVARIFGRKPTFLMQSRVSLRAWGGRDRRVDRAYTGLERLLMRSAVRVYPREPEGARWLRAHGIAQAEYLGNPMLDAVSGEASLEPSPPYLLLLPGSRPDAYYSLPRMLEACRLLRSTGLTPVVAWAGLELSKLQTPGWRKEATAKAEGVVLRLIHPDGTVAHLTTGAFRRALEGARLALSTSGTAAEQAAGFGVPLVGFPTAGPQYTLPFARAQQRMLGRALTLTEPNPEAIAQAARELLSNPTRYAAAQADGKAAMGEAGGAERIARDVDRCLRRLPMIDGG
ncbi:lipid-A-disaccharide synthase-related protein [Calidithermus timidus]|jgi:uncharacterized protein (TIGR03492 family)|uniref:lipid-A-disaccharide synthase-related protein n=1 Tax=Calidithermus timidus TaxID=307124 RepID=UPI00035D035B|nr:lipid-A-disaccharide synthase-related protein [Calidithermus timidus]